MISLSGGGGGTARKPPLPPVLLTFIPARAIYAATHDNYRHLSPKISKIIAIQVGFLFPRHERERRTASRQKVKIQLERSDGFSRKRNPSKRSVERLPLSRPDAEIREAGGRSCTRSLRGPISLKGLSSAR